MIEADVAHYLDGLNVSLRRTEVTDAGGNFLGVSAAVGHLAVLAQATHRRGNTVLFIGNGGSAAIASHMAIDFNKNAGIRALAFNDGAALTCLGNDYTFAEIFSRQLEFHARPNDLLVAISSSGRSADILHGVHAARAIGAGVVTLSGFSPENTLRAKGDINFYVPSESYGFVEISHHVLCHAIVDHLSRIATGNTTQLAYEDALG